MYEYFNLPGHSGFLNDVSVTLIDKTVPMNPTKREDYWIPTLKTKATLGFNVEDDLGAQLIVFCFTDYVYGCTVFGKLFSDVISKLLLYLMLLLLFCCCYCCRCWFRYFIITIPFFRYICYYSLWLC